MYIYMSVHIYVPNVLNNKKKNELNLQITAIDSIEKLSDLLSVLPF